MKVSGVILAILLVVSVASAEAKPTSQIKKDIRDIKPPFDSKSVKILKITQTRTLHVWKIVQVQICAGPEKLYSPELKIDSDRDSIRVTVWGLIMPNTCKTNDFFIMADDPGSIVVSFVGKNTLDIIR